MFGFGASEIVVIVIVLIVLVKPQDLPGISRKVGKIYGTIVKQLNVIKRTFKNFEDEIETLSKVEDEGKKEKS